MSKHVHACMWTGLSNHELRPCAHKCKSRRHDPLYHKEDADRVIPSARFSLAQQLRAEQLELTKAAIAQQVGQGVKDKSTTGPRRIQHHQAGFAQHAGLTEPTCLLNPIHVQQICWRALLDFAAADHIQEGIRTV